jgi:hypothetical protein
MYNYRKTCEVKDNARLSYTINLSNLPNGLGHEVTILADETTNTVDPLPQSDPESEPSLIVSSHFVTCRARPSELNKQEQVRKIHQLMHI